jgi:hypothetical protein
MGWHSNYDPCIWRNRTTEEQKRIGWEMWVRMDKIMCAVLREAHERQVEETMDTLADGLTAVFTSVEPRRRTRSA